MSSLPKPYGKIRRFTFNHVDNEIHTTTHAKSAVYSIQNHEEYEHKSLPLNSNTLEFSKQINDQLILSLYTDKEHPNLLSQEFKLNLFYFYAYFSLYLITIFGFINLLHFNGGFHASHYTIHLICFILLILSAFSILILFNTSTFILKARELFLALGLLTYFYFILADERVLCKITGNPYEADNHLSLILGIVTLGPMLRVITFDHFFYSFLSGMIAFFTFLCSHLATGSYRDNRFFTELALLGIFLAVQVMETHQIDLRIRHLFWRREKEIVVHKDPRLQSIRTSVVNSDVEIIMDICESTRKRLKDVNKVIMYRDVKTVIKESIADIEKIKWKVGHKQDVKVILDPNIDDDDREYIEQNFLEVKNFKSETVHRTFTDMHDTAVNRHSGRFSLMEMESVLSAFGNHWNFDIWFVFDSTGASISIISKYLLSKWNLGTLFSIPSEISNKYFEVLEKAYKPNPYHNACHAADVLHSLIYFIANSSLSDKLAPIDMLSCMIAVLGHDVGHPGVTNRFLINNKDDLALQYNDNSVLENMHSSIVYSLMKKPGCDILANFSQEDWFKIRNYVICMIISTDMSKHFEILGHFRARVLNLKDIEINEFEDKSFVLSIGLKCADLGHSAKTIELHKKWTSLVCEELFAQGDREKDNFLTVSMYCDRENTDIDKSQSGFLKNICMPLYEVWNIYLGSSVVQTNCVDQQVANQKYWEEKGKFRKLSMKPGFITDTFTIV